MPINCCSQSTAMGMCELQQQQLKVTILAAAVAAAAATIPQLYFLLLYGAAIFARICHFAARWQITERSHISAATHLYGRTARSHRVAGKFYCIFVVKLMCVCVAYTLPVFNVVQCYSDICCGFIIYIRSALFSQQFCVVAAAFLRFYSHTHTHLSIAFYYNIYCCC